MKNNNILGILLSILIGIFVFFVGIEAQSDSSPNKVYKVYLNGKTIGLISSKQDFLNLINERQNEIKIKYNVKEVYPPSGLEIKEEYTYSTDISTPEEIYDIIGDKDPFMISGYTVTIKYPAEQATNEDKELIQRDVKYLNILNKDDFEEAFKSVIKAFVSSNGYEMYSTNTQPEIIDVGSQIEAIYWEEIITIKESLISVDSQIFTNANDISKYLLFGTLEEQQSYVVRDGDDIPTITSNNNLSIEEFLVANPQFASEHVLLTPGKNVNVGLIRPMVTITTEMHVVEDVTNSFKTEYIEDKDSYVGTQKTIQEGSDGLTRVTEKVLYRNGDINNLVITTREVLTPAVNKIVSKGVKQYSGGSYTYHGSGGNTEWSWPTIAPYVITSRFGPRWGSTHDGIDISGTGHGSPIYSVQDGVIEVNTYSSGYGHYVVVNHNNGYITLYAHLAQKGRYPVGTEVKREQVIGYMGNSGRSTGTHLHLSVIQDTTFRYRNYLNPCKSIFSC